MRFAAWFVFVSVTVLACSSPAGGSVPLASAAGLDVSGFSNAPCTLTISGNGVQISWDVGPPSPAVADVPADGRHALSGCAFGDASVVTLVSRQWGGNVKATRSSTELCFWQDGGLKDAFNYSSEAVRTCPVSVALVCGGTTLYDHAAWQVCEWLG